ncbi:MAG: serine/threonine protein kinase [Candidatus Thermoplasmatota archaeon]|nr:serine/threonine protein kinase [Candidatus Thermoplasmatota archaeon]
MALNQENVWKEITYLEKQILDYEKKASYLQKIENQLSNPYYISFQEDVSEIQRYIKDFNNISKVTELYTTLYQKIRNFNDQSKKMKEKLDNIPFTFILPEINDIQKLLSDPMRIDQAKEKITQISEEINTRNRIGFPIQLSQYNDIFLIGSGGFSYVYGAKRIKDGKRVAIKIPKTTDKQMGKSFIRELNNWVGLKHPNIVEIYDYNILPIPYIEMEICDSSLDKKKIPLDTLDAIKIIQEICEGIKYAHKKKIVHLDLKPQNILIKEGIIKITDWGMSKLITEHGMTTIGLSLPYAAPEQFSKKFGEKDQQTDIWQLGVLFYYLITGNLLFSGSDYVEYAEKITSKNINKSLKKNDIPIDVAPIIGKCLEKDKKNRYKTINQVQKDLKKLTNDIIQHCNKKNCTNLK